MSAAAVRAAALVLCAAFALAACGNLRVDPPAKDPALYGIPIWTP
jgi:hypothetical protein